MVAWDLRSNEGSDPSRAVDLKSAACCSDATCQFRETGYSAYAVVFDLSDDPSILNPDLDLEILGVSVLDDVRHGFQNDERDRRLKCEWDDVPAKVKLDCEPGLDGGYLECDDETVVGGHSRERTTT